MLKGIGTVVLLPFLIVYWLITHGKNDPANP